MWLAGGLLIGGAVSNLIDRVARGSVVDFIDFSFWPTFNLADVAIVVGVGLWCSPAARTHDGTDES